MRLALAAVALAVLAACGGEPAAEPRAAREPAAEPAAGRPAAVRDVTPTVNAADLVELGELRATVRALERRAGEAEAALAQARAETAKYQAGLDRCVGELNRISGQPAAPAYAPRQAATARESRASVSTLSAPQVQLAGDMIFVTGRLWNSSDADARGRMEVELLRDGSVIDSRTLALDVPARTDWAFSADFRQTASQGTYSARVRLDY